MLSIDSEKVTEILSLTETELRLSVGEVEETVGAVVSTINVFTDRGGLLVLPALSVTLMIQLLWFPSSRVLKSIVLLEAVDELSELLQLPPYVMSPVSVELKMYLGVVSLPGVGTGVTTSTVGAVVSIIN